MKKILFLIIFISLVTTTVFSSSIVLTGYAKKDFVLMVSSSSGLPVKYDISKGKYSERVFFNSGKDRYIFSSYNIISDGIFKLSKVYEQKNFLNTTSNEKYLLSCKYVESNDSEIEKISSKDIIENYKYISKNIVYKNVDFKEATRTLKEKKGVCLNMSNLFAAMCRSKGIMCKVVVGHTKQGNHAWNKVLYKGKWTNIDVTNNFINFSDDFYNAEYEY